MGVGIAASNSFLFPIGHQASVLVYGPGNYRFFDYTKVGLPLTITDLDPAGHLLANLLASLLIAVRP